MQKRTSVTRKLIISAVLVLLLAGAVFLTLNSIVKSEASGYIFGIEDAGKLQKADCVIVLGARVYSDTSLSPVLQDRVDYAIALYNAGKADKLLFSGDHGQRDYDEVNAMMQYAMQNGVPKSDIFLDHAGFSTYETMVRAQEVFCVKSAIVVTQEFHLSRAVYNARRVGIDAYGVNSDPRVYMHAADNEFRESFARVKDYLYVNLFRPAPKYLGEEIPITGDSSLTHDK